MRIFYNLFLYVITPLILSRLLYRSLQTKAYRKRINERFGFSHIQPKPNGIWVHSVSVGESIAAIKLIKDLQKRYPDKSFIVTCGTPTGSQVIQQQLGTSVHHVYLPYDLPGSVKRFLNKCQPVVGIMLETELWPNLLHYADKVGVKLMVANMCLSDKSFRRYQYFPKFVRRMLDHIDVVAAQTDSDAERMIALGADMGKVHVVGNLKFEFAATNNVALHDKESLIYRLAHKRPVWLAGSTHEDEEEMVLKAHLDLQHHDSNLLLILAPRHPERFDMVYKLCQAYFNTQKRSELNDDETLDTRTEVLLLDSIGEMSRFVAISDWCFIGGSLVPIGGHNLLEVCNAGVPVIYGKYMFDTRELAKIVQKWQAGVQVEDERMLLSTCKQLLEDESMRKAMGNKGKALLKSHQGALAKTLDLLTPLIKK